jgi:ferredoxin-NADP reductase
MQWLDRITGTFTMYRLVLYCLVALFIETMLLSLTGVISQQPLAILLSALVLVAFSYSNLVIARIARVKPQAESALITALLLLFIFEPVNPSAATAVLGYTGLAVAVVIANLSKYLLAVRGRHVFNPAALGAFVVALIPAFGDFAAWWLASAWLLPVTVILGFAVLYRTRRLAMAAVFVVAVFAFTVIAYRGAGYELGTLLGLPFLSFSTIFFVAFMLSEPLTLPPRRWQQLAEALIVAVIFSFPFSIAGFSTTTPQFALLVGNLLAFLVGQRRGIRLEFLGRSQLTPTSWELSFQPKHALRFTAGQYLELTVPHRSADSRGVRRMFTVASAPAAGVVQFGLNTAARSSSFKTALLALQPGESISATSVGGDFTLPKDASRPLLLVAGGIGITPFISHLEQLHSSAERRDVVVVYSASTPDELAYAPRLEQFGHPVLVLSRTEPGHLPAGWTYLGHGPLTTAMLAEHVPDSAAREALVSGPPSFVSTVRRTLRHAGVRRVRSDYFTGYTKSARARYKNAPAPQEPAQVA